MKYPRSTFVETPTWKILAGLAPIVIVAWLAAVILDSNSAFVLGISLGFLICGWLAAWADRDDER